MSTGPDLNVPRVIIPGMSTRMHESGAMFRDKMKELREGYFVEYQPADSRFDIASLHLQFFQDPLLTTERAAEFLECEVRDWFRRFPAPIFGSGSTVADEGLDLTSVRPSSYFVGHLDPATRQPRLFWYAQGKSPAIPPEQMTTDYQNAVYAGLPAKLAAEVRAKGLLEHTRVVRAAKTIVLLVAVVPICIELISMGVAWVDTTLTVASVLAGFWKLAKLRSWVKPSGREVSRREEERRMKHHHYHCEQNPEGFARLKAENFERQTRQATLAEAAALGLRERPSLERLAPVGENEP